MNYLGMRCLSAAAYTLLGILVVSTVYLNPQPIEETETEPSELTLDDSVRDINELAEFASDFARSRALYNFVATLDSDGLLDLLDKSSSIESPRQKRATQATTLQRLVGLDPLVAVNATKTLSMQYRSDFLEIVFAEWSQSDLDSAIAQARKLKSEERQAAGRGILQGRDDLSTELLGVIGRQLGITLETEQELNRDGVNDRYVDHQTQWQHLVSDDIDDMVQTDSLVRVAKSLFDNQGITVLDQLFEPDRDNVVRTVVLRSVARHAASVDPTQAFENALNLDDTSQETVAREVVSYWIQSDADAAFDAVNALEPGYLKYRLIRDAISFWASHDPANVLSQLNDLPEDIRTIGEEAAIVAITATVPEKATQFLEGLSNSERRESLTKKVAQEWSRHDPEAALSWASDQISNHDLRRRALQAIIPAVSRHNPELAMQVALDQPEIETFGGLEVWVIGNMVKYDVDHARELLPLVREGASTTRSYKHVGGKLALTNRVLEAIELGSDLHNEDQIAYFQHVTWLIAEQSPKRLLDSIDQFPSKGTKSMAAKYLLDLNGLSRALNEEQLDTARGYLTSN